MAKVTPKYFVKAKQTFLFGGNEVKPGTIIEVKKSFAHELVNSRLAEMSTQEAYDAGKLEVEKTTKQKDKA